MQSTGLLTYYVQMGGSNPTPLGDWVIISISVTFHLIGLLQAHTSQTLPFSVVTAHIFHFPLRFWVLSNPPSSSTIGVVLSPLRNLWGSNHFDPPPCSPSGQWSSSGSCSCHLQTPCCDPPSATSGTHHCCCASSWRFGGLGSPTTWRQASSAASLTSWPLAPHWSSWHPSRGLWEHQDILGFDFSHPNVCCSKSHIRFLLSLWVGIRICCGYWLKIPSPTTFSQQIQLSLLKLEVRQVCNKSLLRGELIKWK